MNVSIGIAGSMPADSVRRLAPLVERLGYRALWVNDTPGGDALDKVAVAAEVTSTLGLATGVIPLDRQSGTEIARRVRDLPIDRLRIGVGSGEATRGLELLETGLAELREGCDAPLVVGGLGPRARALAARLADGILFNWLSPQGAVDAMADLRRDAAGRAVEGILYVRTIVDPEARPALEAEAARYAAIPAYAENFDRQGVTALQTTIDLAAPGAVDAYAALDEVVLRVVTATGADDELVRLLDAGAPTRG